MCTQTLNFKLDKNYIMKTSKTKCNIKKEKKKINFKKSRIILSSMFVFLNCFLWNSSSNICNAENINELTTHKAPTNEKFIGAEITSLNSWKKCSIFSWQTLETYFKQASKKRLGEIKWKIN